MGNTIAITSAYRMSNQTQSVIRRDENSLESLLARPGYQKRFGEVLKERAPQFMSSVLSIGRTMPDVEAKSIVASAMIAATLDLPIEKNLGFAWIVPYRDGSQKYAQFQMGYKGYIQLALRTGRYERMNAKAINQEALGGFDEVGEPTIDWSKVDETKEAVGYAFGFKLIGGFVKVCYWPKKKVLEHAQKYSAAYRKGGATPWKTEFDKMALKTVIANELSDWGILSVEWQTARRADQGVVKDIDAEVEYVDNMNHQEIEDRKPEPTDHQKATATTTTAPAKTTTAPAQATTQPKTTNTQPTEPAKPAEQPAKAPEKAPEPPKPANPPAQETPGAVPGPSGPSAPEKPQQPAAAPQPATQESATPEQIAANEEAAEAAAGLAPEKGNPGEFKDAALEPQQGDTDEILSIKTQLKQALIPFAVFRNYLISKKLMRDNQRDLRELTKARADAINRNMLQWIEDIRAFGKTGQSSLT